MEEPEPEPEAEPESESEQEWKLETDKFYKYLKCMQTKGKRVFFPFLLYNCMQHFICHVMVEGKSQQSLACVCVCVWSLISYGIPPSFLLSTFYILHVCMYYYALKPGSHPYSIQHAGKGRETMDTALHVTALHWNRRWVREGIKNLSKLDGAHPLHHHLHRYWHRYTRNHRICSL